MIEVKESLNVSAKDFFEKIEESIVYDIHQSSGKKVVPKDIKKGFKYKKQLKNKIGRKGEVTVTITNFVSPVCYGAEFKSANGINKILYNIESVDDNNINVIYKEEFVGNTSSADWNFKLMNFFYKRKAKKRAVRMIKAIESYIQSHGA